MALVRSISVVGRSFNWGLPLFKCYSVSSISFSFSGYPIRNKVTAQQAAQELIFRLNPRERTILLEELQKIETQAIAIQGATKQNPPSAAQLRSVATYNAMPFVGFGFLDNFIMIIAGDYIDSTIGITLGISTMAAAGLGNALSDVAGIGSAWYVEQIATKIGMNAPSLTPAQLSMSRTRWCANLGRAFGVACGCILGMFPLFFLPSKDAVIQSSTEK